MSIGLGSNKTARYAVFDLDGTLADITHRIPLIRGCDKPDWDSFFEACDKDVPIWNVIRLAQAVYGGRDELVILTGRNEIVKNKTRIWLSSHDIHYDHLVMRERYDHRPDHEFKESILVNVLGKDKVRYVIEDRQRVVDMWRAHGVTCLQCANGKF